MDKFLKNNWKLHTAVLILIIFGMLAPTILSFRLPWALDAAFTGLGFFHIARKIHGTKVEKLLNIKLWQAILIGIAISALTMVSPKINMRTGSYGWYLPFWFNALGAIAAGWNLAQYIERLLGHGKILRGGSGWLKGMGKTQSYISA